MTSPLRIVVLGYVVRGPLGGMAWHHLQYAAGLARLGHDVWFVEDSDDYPACYDPDLDATGTDPAYGLAFADRAFSLVGLSDRWAYFDAHGGGWLGPAARVAPRICRTADLLLDLSGVNPLRPWVEDVPIRVLVDTDPGFTQARHVRNEGARRRAAGHTAFFTFAENVGAAARLPDDGFAWIGTRQPVVLDFWPESVSPVDAAFTTVMVWESYPAMEVDGLRLGLKADSFQPYLDLPSRVDVPLELALGGPTAPRRLLGERGWRVRDPRTPTRTLESHQRYVRSSRGEFSVAKHGYVVTRSGWFSERSTAYLATGRPVITQDTGFTEWLPAGVGVVPFSSLDEAVAAIADVTARYDRHRRAARDLVAEFFDSSVVLNRLLEQIFASGTTRPAGRAAQRRLETDDRPPGGGSGG